MAAALAGIVSHLVLDAVPHWGCSYEAGRADFLTVAKRDGVLGLAAMATAVLAVERPVRTATTVAAMAGAVLLDLDKPFLFFLGVNPFPEIVQDLHRRIQNESPGGLPNEVRFGCAFAVADLLTVVRARRAG